MSRSHASRRRLSCTNMAGMNQGAPIWVLVRSKSCNPCNDTELNCKFSCDVLRIRLLCSVYIVSMIKCTNMVGKYTLLHGGFLYLSQNSNR